MAIGRRRGRGAVVSWEQLSALARSHGTTSLSVVQGGEVVLDESWPAPEDAVLPPVLRIEQLPDGRSREDVASAQKSVTSILVGIAVGLGLVELDQPVSEYTGYGWSRAAVDDERRITVRHLLTMTSGLGDAMRVVAPPGSTWDYNLGAGYHTLKRVLRGVTGDDVNTLSRRWLFGPLGMNESEWSSRPVPPGLDEPLRSMACYPDGEPLEGLTTTARDLARFGNAILAGGAGLDVASGYLAEALSPSPLNPAYGYLWWLNGQPWHLAPKQPDRVDGWLIPEAPADLVAALGALGRALYVVPSLDAVVVRLGVSPGPTQLAATQFGHDLWTRLRPLLEATP